MILAEQLIAMVLVKGAQNMKETVFVVQSVKLCYGELLERTGFALQNISIV